MSAKVRREPTRRVRFSKPFSLGTISESDNISTSKSTPLVTDKSVEPRPGDGVAGNGEDNDNSGESFFEGFFNDTESYDDTSLIISAASQHQQKFQTEVVYLMPCKPLYRSTHALYSHNFALEGAIFALQAPYLLFVLLLMSEL